MARSIPRWSLLGQRVLAEPPVAFAWDPSAPAAPSTAVLLMRACLVSGCVLAVGIAFWMGDPLAYLTADADLARLLRGMALIKGMIAIAVVSAVFWRLAWPVSTRAGIAYLLSSWTIAGSTMLIWQLSYIVPAALLFHGAALSLLLVGLRERNMSMDSQG